MPAELADVERQKNIAESNSRLQRRAARIFTLPLPLCTRTHLSAGLRAHYSTAAVLQGIRFNDRVSFSASRSPLFPADVRRSGFALRRPVQGSEAMVTPNCVTFVPDQAVVFDTALPVASSVGFSSRHAAITWRDASLYDFRFV